MSARIAPGTGAIATLILLITAACGDDEGLPAATTGSTIPTPAATIHPAMSTTPTPLATPTPGAPAIPEVIDGVEVVPLPFGEEMELPEDTALIIKTGSYSFPEPPHGFFRVYRDASGELRTDELFTTKSMGLTTSQGSAATRPHIYSYALNSDASEIVISVCTRGTCTFQVWASPDAQTTLYRSLDGGITWEQFGVLDGSTHVAAITQDGVLLLSQSQGEPQPKLRLFPSGEPVQPPPGASSWPHSLPGGELAWSTEDGRLLRSDGSQILAVGQDAWVSDVVPDASGERLAAGWRESANQYRFGIFSRDGKPMSAYSLPDFVGVGGWLTDTLVVGNAVPPGLLPTPLPGGYETSIPPTIFDLQTGEAHALAGPFREAPLGGHNEVQAVLHGPFARVVNTGSCLNVRAEPAMTASTLTCAADGVLLRDTGETRNVDGIVWCHVVTPAGVEGWATSQFLER
jgi:hypothetical protein